jgi:hypothetical protein
MSEAVRSGHQGEERRKKRLLEWQDTEGIVFINPQAQRAYAARAARLSAVYNLEEPDRVPVTINVGSIPAYHYGLDYRTVAYDFERLVKTWERFNQEYAEGLDNFALPQRIFPLKVLDLLEYRLYHWPGHGLPEDSRGYQYAEGEYMKAEEYPAFIQDPSDFWLRTYLPRIFGALEPFRSFRSLTHIIELPMTDFTPLARPDVQAALLSLVKAGKEFGKWLAACRQATEKMIASGFPILRSFMAKAPFDTLGDTLRGTKGILLDLYRRPEMVLQAVERITELTVAEVVQTARNLKAQMVLFPLHKGADGWMNPKQFETFYWPSLKKVVEALVEEGVLVTLFAEGRYDSRLESVNDFPKGAVCWWFDQTDMARAKKILGDRCAIQGNVPTSLLVTGTPEEVKAYCRKVIEACAPGGGFILCPGASSDEARLENLLAMAEAAKEYGAYRKG